jgi:hypothetical protein
MRLTRTTVTRTRHVTFRLSFATIDQLITAAAAKNATMVSTVEAAIAAYAQNLGKD